VMCFTVQEKRLELS